MPVSLPYLANISALNLGSRCLSLSSMMTPTYGNWPFKIRRSENLKTLHTFRFRSRYNTHLMYRYICLWQCYWLMLPGPLFPVQFPITFWVLCKYFLEVQ
jgi:hypothetical protein